MIRNYRNARKNAQNGFWTYSIEYLEGMSLSTVYVENFFRINAKFICECGKLSLILQSESITSIFYVKLKKPSTTGFRCEDIRQA